MALTTHLPAWRHGGDDHGHSHGDDNVAVQAALAHVIGDIAPRPRSCRAGGSHQDH